MGVGAHPMPPNLGQRAARGAVPESRSRLRSRHLIRRNDASGVASYVPRSGQPAQPTAKLGGIRTDPILGWRGALASAQDAARLARYG